jgi:transcriptional regulator with AAA-type ATPase domain
MPVMAVLRPDEQRLAERVHAISTVNPFREERVAHERAALGPAYVEIGPVKSFDPRAGPNPNTPVLRRRAEEVLAAVQSRAAAGGARPTARDRTAAGDLGLFVLYNRHRAGLEDLALTAERGAEGGRLKVAWYERFAADAEACLRLRDDRLRPEDTAPKLLGLFFQIARAFVNVYASFVGRTAPAVALRASMWESIFTHDLVRYRRALMGASSRNDSGVMADIPTLVTGPSGTGKELVARAVGRSCFVALDERRKAFDLDPAAHFLPIHLAALSPSLIESELFGHRRGAFTGALEDRASFLETCAPDGAVFLDEIAEVDVTLQVKLLRVLQTREFQRLGDSTPRRFTGRLISATNRDLATEIAAGRFRDDLYFRINADRLETPRLAELIGGAPDELEHLAGYVADRLLPRDQEGGAESRAFAAELCGWIEANLGLDYAWPGNFRELEQCARAVLIRGRYRPEGRAAPDDLSERVRAADLSADELLTRYCALVYDREGTFDGAARRLGLDRRTVRARVAKLRAAERGAFGDPA